jgi:hypothetical protein
MTARKKVTPRATHRDQFPATGTASDPPHVGRAMKGCGCMCCVEHRSLDRQVLRDRALDALYADAAIGTVRTGDNASQALRSALGLDE